MLSQLHNPARLFARFLVLATLSLAFAMTNTRGDEPLPVVKKLHGYPNCISMTNGETVVVLCPEAGGRVLEYTWKNENALYLEEAETGIPHESRKQPSMTAGRFDIGPEKTIPKHEVLWSGKWTGQIVGPRHARLTSQADTATGVQLVREFQLASSGTHLVITQTMKNVSQRDVAWCYWCRTFARGEGICLIPLTSPSRFPKSYVMYEGGDLINIRPQDPNIRTRDGFLEILAAPREPKLGMDTYAGWFAYVMRHGQAFVKRYPTYPDGVYNEAAGLTMSIWYPPGARVELEPIGPRQQLAPGQAASFKEEWWLLPVEFPTAGNQVDLTALQQSVDAVFSASQ